MMGLSSGIRAGCRRMSGSLLRVKSVVLGFFLVLSGCGRSERPEIGTRLDSPISLASHPSQSVYYVLNASLGGEYQTGSLQTYAVPGSSQTAASPLVTLPTPRLGTSIAVEPNGEFLVAGFSGTQAEVRVFNLDARGLPAATDKPEDRVVISAGRIGSIKLYPVSAQAGTWTVVVSLADRSVDARTLVYKYTRTLGFSRVAQFPNDFYSPSRDNVLGAYTMAWGLPIVFPGFGILVAFPQGTQGYFGKNPSPLDWLQGKAVTSSPLYDLRTVSALVVDLNALMAGQPSHQTVGFVPLAANAFGQKGEPAQPADEQMNADYQFKVGFQSALAIDSAALPCQLSGPFSGISNGTSVVAINSEKADIIAFSGWEQAANQIRTRIAAGEFQPVLGDVLTPSAVSLSSAITQLDGIRTLVPNIQVVNTGSMCTLSWLRIDQARSSLGREQSRFQVATDANPANQLLREADVLGLAHFTVSGQSILAGSFGTNKVQVLRFNGNALENVGVFGP